VGHYGGRGMTAALTVHHVFTTYEHVCCVFVRVLNMNASMGQNLHSAHFYPEEKSSDLDIQKEGQVRVKCGHCGFIVADVVMLLS
jgi:hypothetical protein